MPKRDTSETANRRRIIMVAGGPWPCPDFMSQGAAHGLFRPRLCDLRHPVPTPWLLDMHLLQKVLGLTSEDRGEQRLQLLELFRRKHLRLGRHRMRLPLVVVRATPLAHPQRRPFWCF